MSTFPAYRVPSERPKSATNLHWQAPLVGITFFIASMFVVTQQLAWTFGNQPRLGHPLFGTIYPPWSCFVWFIQFSLSKDARVQSALLHGFIEIVAGSLLSMVLSAYVSRRIISNEEKGSEDLHGSSRFASVKEIKQSPLASVQNGAYIGAFHDTPQSIKYLRDPSDEHILAFAPTGTAKTTGLCMPTLLDNPQWSMLVSDPKGELHQKTSGYRARFGKVLKFAPVEESGSHFNIFGEIRLGTMRDVSDAQNLAHMHCHVPGKEAIDPHWDDIAESLVTGIELHEAYKARNEGRVVTGRDIAMALTPIAKNKDGGQKTFTDTLTEMITYDHDPDGILYGWTLPDGKPTRTHPVVIEKAMEMINRMAMSKNEDGSPNLLPNDEFSGALSTAKRRFEIYADPLIQRNTESSDFTISDLVDGPEPCTLYLVIPLSDQERLIPLVRVLITVFFNRLTEPERAKKRNKWPMLWLMEEFTTFGRMEIFQKRIPLVRGFGIKCFLIVQSTEQIADIYGDHQSIVNNCGIQIAYTPNDNKTAELLQSLTGKRTVLQAAHTFSGKLGAISKNNVTTAVQHVERWLMTADEVRRLRPPEKVNQPDGSSKITVPGDMLIFQNGHYPILGRQLLYFFDPEFLKRSQIPELTDWPKIERRKK